jgi:hypothetical protein
MPARSGYSGKQHDYEKQTSRAMRAAGLILEQVGNAIGGLIVVQTQERRTADSAIFRTAFSGRSYAGLVDRLGLRHG